MFLRVLSITGMLLLIACTSATPESQPVPSLPPLPVPPETAVLWTLQIGRDGGTAVAVDSEGNVLMAGRSLLKYDPGGTELWRRTFDFLTPEEEGSSSLVIDSSGYAYVAGRTSGLVRGPVGEGDTDVFLLKYDPAGNEIWSRKFGSSRSDGAFDVAVDDQGGIYVAGAVGGVLPEQAGAGLTDAFVRKYDANGAEVWTRQFGSSAEDWASSLAVDESANVYVFGPTQGALPGQENAGDPENSSNDVFIRKYSRLGEEVWTRQFGSPDFEIPSGVAVDKQGNVFVAGTTGGALVREANPRGVFLRKYAPSGEELWTRQFSTGEEDFGRGLAVDKKGHAYLTGTTFGVLPGQTKAGDVDSSIFSNDAFLRQYDPTGKELWTHQFGSADADEAFGVAVDEEGNVYVAGRTDGVLPGQVSAEGLEFFLRKYGR